MSQNEGRISPRVLGILAQKLEKCDPSIALLHNFVWFWKVSSHSPSPPPRMAYRQSIWFLVKVTSGGQPETWLTILKHRCIHFISFHLLAGLSTDVNTLTQGISRFEMLSIDVSRTKICKWNKLWCSCNARLRVYRAKYVLLWKFLAREKIKLRKTFFHLFFQAICWLISWQDGLFVISLIQELSKKTEAIFCARRKRPPPLNKQGQRWQFLT